MTEARLREIQAVVEAKRIAITPEEARDLAIRAFMFKRDRGRVPSLTAADPWERRMAEGAKAFVRFKDEGRYDG
ncbi:MAG: hypothetical protein M3434_03770 [Gemmatimonadota bacterium]|nr:hypothetical protein [Gemmatimonadota bacterium]